MDISDMESILVFKKLEQVRDLPTLPLILDKLRVAIRNPNSDANKIAAIIGDDPAMMARILKVVNSALYGGTGKIDSLKMAIARLGFNAVNNLAISTSVFKAFGSGEDDFDRKEFWRHCVSTGIAGGAIMDACRKSLSRRYEKEMLHLAGLIHDVGKLVFDQYFHDDFMEALSKSKAEGIPLNKAEYKVFGTDHTAVGAWLAKKWQMSDQLAECILWHHRPQKAKADFQELVRIIEVANYICNYRMIGNSGDVSKPTCSEDSWKMLKLSEEDYYGIMDQIVAESSKSEVLLSLM
jgi:putative nucleotidyltransferase with HDIG domain